MTIFVWRGSRPRWAERAVRSGFCARRREISTPCPPHSIRRADVAASYHSAFDGRASSRCSRPGDGPTHVLLFAPCSCAGRGGIDGRSHAPRFCPAPRIRRVGATPLGGQRLARPATHEPEPPAMPMGLWGGGRNHVLHFLACPLLGEDMRADRLALVARFCNSAPRCFCGSARRGRHTAHGDMGACRLHDSHRGPALADFVAAPVFLRGCADPSALIGDALGAMQGPFDCRLMSSCARWASSVDRTSALPLPPEKHIHRSAPTSPDTT